MSAADAVSVVIPMHEARATIVRALRSVLAQAPEDLDVVVVDDGSSDGGAEVVAGVGDARIRVVRQRRQGASAARNAGVSAARHPWVAFLDADDEWRPGHLEAFHRARLALPTCDVVATGYVYRAGEQERAAAVAVSPAGADDPMPLDDYFDVACRGSPPVWSSAVFVRKTALEAIGGFPHGVASGEDLLTWARLAARGRVAYVPRATAVFHLRPGTLGGGRLRRMPSDTWTVGPALELLSLTAAPPRRRSIRRYAGRFYVGQAVQWVQVPRRREALRCVLRAAWLWPFDRRIPALAVLALLPTPLVRWVFARRDAS